MARQLYYMVETIKMITAYIIQVMYMYNNCRFIDRIRNKWCRYTVHRFVHSYKRFRLTNCLGQHDNMCLLWFSRVSENNVIIFNT